MNFRELLSQKVELSRDQLEQLTRHYDLLHRWNPIINLTRIENLADAVNLHYCESILLARDLPQGPLSIADVGSGAGFPGIPVAIVRPECDVTLIESHKRKAVFLREVARGIPNLRVIDTRAEDVSGQFDWVVDRAVSPADVLRLPLASNYAILMSEPDLAKLPRPVSVTKYPWGNNRVLAMFHVEHDRIDQTSG